MKSNPKFTLVKYDEHRNDDCIIQSFESITDARNYFNNLGFKIKKEINTFELVYSIRTLNDHSNYYYEILNLYINEIEN